MSVNSRNNNYLLNQQIALLKQVASTNRNKSNNRKVNFQQSQNIEPKSGKFYSSQSYTNGNQTNSNNVPPNQ